jgi:hypothetical protein
MPIVIEAVDEGDFLEWLVPTTQRYLLADPSEPRFTLEFDFANWLECIRVIVS